jgi:hypothetical protein
LTGRPKAQLTSITACARKTERPIASGAIGATLFEVVHAVEWTTKTRSAVKKISAPSAAPAEKSGAITLEPRLELIPRGTIP